MRTSDLTDLSSGVCVAYRNAQVSGNHLKDFYYMGYNSLENPVDVTQRSSFNQTVAPYFQACATSGCRHWSYPGLCTRSRNAGLRRCFPRVCRLDQWRVKRHKRVSASGGRLVSSSPVDSGSPDGIHSWHIDNRDHRHHRVTHRWRCSPIRILSDCGHCSSCSAMDPAEGTLAIAGADPGD